MKKLAQGLIAILVLFQSATYATQTAQARLWCLSLRFQRGSGPSGFYTLDLTTLQSGVNGELAPLFQSYSHWCYFNMNDNIFDEVIPGLMNINTPPRTDSDGDGFDDFFDVSKEVSGSSSGALSTAVGNGSVNAAWNRPAGSALGTCVLTLYVNGYGSLGSFTHTFQIIEYKGPLLYSPTSTNISGTAALVQSGDPSSSLQGPFELVRDMSDPFNTLNLQIGAWTNASQQTLTFQAATIHRDESWPTNYYGYVVFDDGDLNTAAADYSVYEISIDDPNDSDHDGVPDFSDDPALVAPGAPSLALSTGLTNFWLTITGDIGRVHHLLEASSLDAASWWTNISFTLTNSPQIVSLPVSTNRQRFWRVLAQ